MIKKLTWGGIETKREDPIRWYHIKLVISNKFIEYEGVAWPIRYAHSHKDWMRGITYFYVMPLNLFVAVGVWLYAVVKYKASFWLYNNTPGREEYRKGYHDGIEAMKKQINTWDKMYSFDRPEQFSNRIDF